jgi:DNA-binding NtrC family response regulator
MYDLKKKTVFIVDDDPFWSSMLEQMLVELGYTDMVTCGSGEECIRNLHMRPSVIFLDYNLDDMNGLDVLKHVKSLLPETAVIFCTAQEDIHTAVTAIRSGSFDYLLKSKTSRTELAAILKTLKETIVAGEKVY